MHISLSSSWHRRFYTTIRFHYTFLNDENFVDGGISNSTPVLFLKLFDESGINTVGNGIGHDLVAILDDQTSSPIVLNDYYESVLDDYKSGEIRYPFSKLPDGTYNLKVKVWDVSNNSSEAITEFTVASSSVLKMEKVFNFPNPVTDYTTFQFEHNHPNEDLDLSIFIFDMNGQMVREIHKIINSPGTRSISVKWNGRNRFGAPLANGAYVYKVQLQTQSGLTTSKSERLLIIH